MYQVPNQINRLAAQQPRLHKAQQRALDFQDEFHATDNVKEILVTPRGCWVTTGLLSAASEPKREK